MLKRRGIVFAVVAMLATSCGLLGANDTDKDTGLTVPLTIDPTAGPTAIADVPSATVVGTTQRTAAEDPTAIPPPTPTPRVEDSFVTLVASVREIFRATDKAAAIEAVIPVPVPLTIPTDAIMQSLELEYQRWDLWRTVTANFAPVDQPASMLLKYRYLTEGNIADLTAAQSEAFSASGFDVEVDDSEVGVFADTQYVLNGGFSRPGRGGTARFVAIRQGDLVLVELEIATELALDTEPAVIDWPTLFPVPFSGGFTRFTVFSVIDGEDVEAAATAIWTLSATLTDRSLALETLAEAYPADTVDLDGPIVSAGEQSVAVTTFVHPTGATGSVSADEFLGASVFEFRMVSQPG